MALEKEVNAKHERKISGEEWCEILRRTLRPTNNLTDYEFTLLPPMYARFADFFKRRRKWKGFKMFDFSVSDFDEADDIIELEVYREVMASYDEEFAEIDLLESVADRLTSISVSDRNEIEELRRVSDAVKQIDEEIALRKRITRHIMSLRSLKSHPISINYDLILRIIKRHFDSYDESIKELRERKQKTVESIFWIFDKRISFNAREATQILNKIKQIREKAKKSFQKATRKLININRLLKNPIKEKAKQFKQQIANLLKEKNVEVTSLLTKYHNWEKQLTIFVSEPELEAYVEEIKQAIIKVSQRQSAHRINKWWKKIFAKRKKSSSQQQEPPHTEEQPNSQEIPRTESQDEPPKEQPKNKTVMIVSRYQFMIRHLQRVGVKINDTIRISLTILFRRKKEIRNLFNRILHQQDQQAIQLLKDEKCLKQLLRGEIKLEAKVEMGR